MGIERREWCGKRRGRGVEKKEKEKRWSIKEKTRNRYEPHDMNILWVGEKPYMGPLGLKKYVT